LFHVDPIQILNCTEIEWLMRLACAKVIAQQREKDAEEAEKRRGR